MGQREVQRSRGSASSRYRWSHLLVPPESPCSLCSTTGTASPTWKTERYLNCGRFGQGFTAMPTTRQGLEVHRGQRDAVVGFLAAYIVLSGGTGVTGVTAGVLVLFGCYHGGTGWYHVFEPNCSIPNPVKPVIVGKDREVAVSTSIMTAVNDGGSGLLHNMAGRCVSIGILDKVATPQRAAANCRQRAAGLTCSIGLASAATSGARPVETGTLLDSRPRPALAGSEGNWQIQNRSGQAEACPLSS